MKIFKKVIYATILMMIFSFSPVLAQDSASPVVGGKELTLEEAVTRAKNRSKQLKLQQKNIDYAKADLANAYEEYQNAMEFSYDLANANYAIKYANQQYEKKMEPILEERIVYDLETQFDSIIDLEERYALAQDKLELDTQKVRNTVRKQQLGLESETEVETGRGSLEIQLKEIQGLEQSIQAGYRKLNDTIGGKNETYTLIKENIYTPVDQKRSLEGYISHAIDTDPRIWLQGESAEAQKGTIWANTANGAPTYSEYQKRKLGYEQGAMGVAISKETMEQSLKDMYKDILNLEVQYEKIFPALEEAKRQYRNLEKRYELGLLPKIVIEEAHLGVMQTETQLGSLIRQHNQLKTLFEKPYMM